MKTDSPHSSRRVLIAAAVLLAALALIWLAVTRDRAARPSAPSVPAIAPDERAFFEEPSASLPVGQGALRTASAGQELRPAKPNAADLYKSAFALLDTLTEDEKKLLRQRPVDPESTAALALLAKLQPLYEWMKQAAQMDWCDWGLGKMTVTTPMTHCTKARDLGKATLWMARMNMESDPAQALELMASRAQLGSHISESWLGVLINVSIANTGFQALAEASDFLQEDAFHDNVAKFAHQFVSPGDLLRAAHGEIALSHDILSRLDAEPSLAETMALDQALRTDLQQVLASPERWAAEQEAYKSLLADGNYLTMTNAEFSAWKSRMQTAVAGTTLASQHLESVISMRNAVKRFEVLREMFVAGTLIKNGADPAQAMLRVGQFSEAVYEQVEGGFRLTSPIDPTRPTTLDFAPPAETK